MPSVYLVICCSNFFSLIENLSNGNKMQIQQQRKHEVNCCDENNSNQ